MATESRRRGPGLEGGRGVGTSGDRRSAWGGDGVLGTDEVMVAQRLECASWQRTGC